VSNIFNLYFQKLKQLLNTVEQEEGQKLKTAARKVADCIETDGIVHVFGCGHSHMLAEELFYRAGGLAAINPILIEDLMLHKGAVRSSYLEKQNNYSQQFLGSINIQPEDVVIVISTSGRNPVPIDVALYAKQQGAYVIAISSLVYTKSLISRHKSRQFLTATADLSIDNHIMVGDTLLELDTLDVSFGSGSTVAGAAIVNGIMVEAVKCMIENNFTPPIFKSGNADGAEEHNRILINKYKSRIPLLDNI
jgi:uncharacterized phosphosugar-binding protein